MWNRKAFRAIVIAGTLVLGTTGVASAKSSPVPGKPGTLNIVQFAIDQNQRNGEFDYLLTAATCPELNGAVVGLLSGKDRYTLFAPTDAAFEKLLGILKPGVTPTPAMLCDTSVLPTATLFNVLAYHVTDGRRFSNSVFNKRSTKMVEMLNDQYIVTSPSGTINETVKPVLPFINLNASNGVIHVIDTVLLPN